MVEQRFRQDGAFDTIILWDDCGDIVVLVVMVVVMVTVVLAMMTMVMTMG